MAPPLSSFHLPPSSLLLSARRGSIKKSARACATSRIPPGHSKPVSACQSFSFSNFGRRGDRSTLRSGSALPAPRSRLPASTAFQLFRFSDFQLFQFPAPLPAPHSASPRQNIPRETRSRYRINNPERHEHRGGRIAQQRVAQRTQEQIQSFALLPAHQSIRRSPLTASKCLSRLTMGSRCSLAKAAIQQSLAGIGVPSFLSCRRTSA